MIASENSLFDYGSWLSAFLFVFTLLFLSVWFHANARKLCKRFPIPDIKEGTDASTIIEAEARTRDLEGIFCKHHDLGSMWDAEASQHDGMRILLSGVTGYVGKMVLFELLRRLNDESKVTGQSHQKTKIVLIIRQRKTSTPEERLLQIRQDVIFGQFPARLWDRVELAESSGLENVNCGFSNETLQHLEDMKITHIIHCAGDVAFERPLAPLAESNITASLRMQEFAVKWPSCKKMVYASTAFVNPNSGSADAPMPEKLVNLGGVDAQELYDSMLGDQKLAKQVKKDMGFQNNYVFSKCVGENLLTRNIEGHELSIVRPAIVGASFVLPFPGWNGDRPSTITGSMTMIIARLIRVMAHTSRGPAAVIPVDVVATGIVYNMLSSSAAQANHVAGSATIRNFAFASSSPKNVFCMREANDKVVAWCVQSGHHTIWDAALYLFVNDITEFFPATFGLMHVIVNCVSLCIVALVQSISMRCFGMKVFPKVKADKILKSVDTAKLYTPFTKRVFYFEGSIHVPASFDKDMYLFHMFNTCQDFYSRLVLKKNKDSPADSKPVASSTSSSSSPSLWGMGFISMHRR